MHQERETKHPQPGAAAGQNVFRLEGEYWTIAYDGAVYRLPDTAGLRYLAHLLQRPGQKVAAVELARHGREAGPEPNRRALGGLSRTDDLELARVKTTRSIRSAMQRIGAQDAALSAHLRATIKTGMYCSYTPDPRLPVEWEF